MDTDRLPLADGRRQSKVEDTDHPLGASPAAGDGGPRRVSHAHDDTLRRQSRVEPSLSATPQVERSGSRRVSKAIEADITHSLPSGDLRRPSTVQAALGAAPLEASEGENGMGNVVPIDIVRRPSTVVDTPELAPGEYVVGWKATRRASRAVEDEQAVDILPEALSRRESRVESQLGPVPAGTGSGVETERTLSRRESRMEGQQDLNLEGTQQGMDAAGPRRLSKADGEVLTERMPLGTIRRESRMEGQQQDFRPEGSRRISTATSGERIPLAITRRASQADEGPRQMGSSSRRPSTAAADHQGVGRISLATIRRVSQIEGMEGIGLRATRALELGEPRRPSAAAADDDDQACENIPPVIVHRASLVEGKVEVNPLTIRDVGLGAPRRLSMAMGDEGIEAIPVKVGRLGSSLDRGVRVEGMEGTGGSRRLSRTGGVESMGRTVELGVQDQAEESIGRRMSRRFSQTQTSGEGVRRESGKVVTLAVAEAGAEADAPAEAPAKPKETFVTLADAVSSKKKIRKKSAKAAMTGTFTTTMTVDGFTTTTMMMETTALQATTSVPVEEPEPVPEDESLVGVEVVRPRGSCLVSERPDLIGERITGQRNWMMIDRRRSRFDEEEEDPTWQAAMMQEVPGRGRRDEDFGEKQEGEEVKDDEEGEELAPFVNEGSVPLKAIG